MATDPLDRQPRSLTRTRLEATPSDKAVTLRVIRSASAGVATGAGGLRRWGEGVGKIRPGLSNGQGRRRTDDASRLWMKV
jgi:hypothetical protein